MRHGKAAQVSASRLADAAERAGRERPALSRRSALAALCAAPLVFGPRQAAARYSRVVALDYVMAELLVVLGHPPLAVSDAGEWGRWVGEPALDPATIDIGTALAPNIELIAGLRPDLVLVTDFTATYADQLARIAPVERFSIYAPGGSPLPKAENALRRLGALFGREAQAEAYLADTARFFAAAAERARPFRDRPVLMLAFLDPRHARIYARPGLQQDVLDRLGLLNAWKDEGSYWGFTTGGIERLAVVGDAAAIADYLPDDVRVVLERSPLWRELPFRRAATGPIPVLPAVSAFGGVAAARRLASLLLDILESGRA